MKLFLSFLFLIAQQTTINAQEAEQENGIIHEFKSFTDTHKNEKVYLHTDRRFYSPGDLLWYQSYTVNATNNQPSQLSKVVWVELYSKTNKLISRQKTLSNNGYGHGQLELPKSLEPGSYLLRSYTALMRNYPEEFMFEKEIVVVDSTIKPLGSSGNDLGLQFLPEGGHLVNGIKSKVAFKAVNSGGLGVHLKGEIVDQYDSIITEFITEYNGMGVFSIIPTEGKKYKARVNNYPIELDLPTPKELGYVLEVNNAKKNTFDVFIRSNVPNSSDRQSLVIHSKGKVIYTFEPRLKVGENKLTIPKIHLPDGISHVTLFDENNNIIADRLIHVTGQKSQISIELESSSFDKRSKVSAKIVSQNQQSIDGVFSVSIIDLGQTLDSIPDQTIVSELLLSSDLKGYVEKPAYYFDSSNPLAKSHLDLLMLVQGWTRFSWNSITALKTNEDKYLAEKGLEINGRVLNERGNKALENGTVTFLNKNVIPTVFKQASTDVNGRFTMKDVKFYEGDQVVFQAVNKRGATNVSLQLDTPNTEHPPLTNSKRGSMQFNFSDGDFTNFSDHHQKREYIKATYEFDSTKFRDLGEYVIQGKKLIQRQGNRGNVYGQSDYTVDFRKIDTSPYHNPFQALQGRIPGVKIEIGGTDVKISLRNSVGYENNTPLSQLMPLILLDNHAMRYEELTSIPPTSIDRVEVYKGNSASAFGSEGAAGVIAFYSKVEKDILDEDGKGAISMTLPGGYNRPLEFYSPQYYPDSENNTIPDQRLLLHWEPMLFFTNESQKTIEFYNTDRETNVLINVQGLSSDGSVFNASKLYKISK